MAAIAFDTLKAARRLKEAGVPEAQAEAHAEIMAEAFVFNMDALVTKDYLDTRFAEFEARIGREIDQRFAAQDARFDQRFNDLESRMQLGFAEVETRFARVNVMLAVILAALAVPVLQTLLVWIT